MRFVKLSIDDAIATVTLDNPGGNRINFKMRTEVLDAFEQVAASQARVLLVKGAGDDFCLGGDAGEWIGIPSGELRPKIEVFAKAIDALGDLTIPTIAVVQGGCMGGGFELALGCDLILAADNARFEFPEATLGIMTLQGGVYLLAERIGRTKAIELVMLSTMIDADKMRDWNVVSQIVERSKLEAASVELSRRFATGPANAFAGTKELLKIWTNQGPAAARGALYDITMPLFDHPNVQQALARAANAAR